MRDTVTRVEDDTGGAARGVEREHGLDGNVHGWGVEGLEHDLGHLFAVGLGVERRLGEDGVLLRGDAELVVKRVVPDLLHVVPVGDDRDISIPCSMGYLSVRISRLDWASSPTYT